MLRLCRKAVHRQGVAMAWQYQMPFLPQEKPRYSAEFQPTRDVPMTFKP